MLDFKTLARRLLYPPVWLILLLAVISTAALITVFTGGLEQSPVAYVAYVLSAYALTVLCLFVVQTLPAKLASAKQRVYAHPVGYQYLTDVGYKVRISLYITLGINLFYAIIKLISGIWYSSPWTVFVAIYYMLLAVLRFLLLRYLRGDKNNSEVNLTAEFRWYRIVGWLMLLINLTLSGMVLHMMGDLADPISNEILVIASAAYTFYAVTMSVVDVIRYRRYQSPVISAAKAIRFTAALISLLSLEISMLLQYSTDIVLSRWMTALTGAAVCAVVVATSVYMIVHATKEIKKRK